MSEECYHLTPKSVLGPGVEKDLYRYMALIGCNAIVIEDGTFAFRSVYPEPPKAVRPTTKKKGRAT